MNHRYTVLDKLYNFGSGVEVYSPVFGNGKVYSVTDRIMVKFDSEHNNKRFDMDGKMNGCGECVLFPSKESKDWNSFEYWGCFKKGDYIKVNGCPVIFSHVEGDNYYVICGVNYKGEFIVDKEDGFGNAENLQYPTTVRMDEGEIESFNKTIKENGYQFVCGSLLGKGVNKFDDGDFIMDEKANYAIFKKCIGDDVYCYCHTNEYDDVIIGGEESIGKTSDFKLCDLGETLAFNDILLENGYRWDNGVLVDYTKERPEFEVGSLIRKKDSHNVIMFISAINYEERKYEVCRSRYSKTHELSFDLENQYEVFEPKFKAGDVIGLVDNDLVGTKFKIDVVDGAQYVMTGGATLFVGLQDNYALVKDGEGTNIVDVSDDDCKVIVEKKPFDFKPFDKVLVRLLDTDKWKIGLFSHIDYRENGNWYVVNDISYRQCIPFNKFTEHLVNSVDHAPSVFKRW